MTTRIYKLFGIKILEIQDWSMRDVEKKEMSKAKKPQGEVIEYTPEEYQKDKDQETVNKMEGK